MKEVNRRRRERRNTNGKKINEKSKPTKYIYRTLLPSFLCSLFLALASTSIYLLLPSSLPHLPLPQTPSNHPYLRLQTLPSHTTTNTAPYLLHRLTSHAHKQLFTSLTSTHFHVFPYSSLHAHKSHNPRLTHAPPRPGLAVYHTEDCGECRRYNFRRIQTTTIRLQVKAERDAAICLSPCDDNDLDHMYEVFIGCWGGGESGIRRKGNEDVLKVETPDILCRDEFRSFWIKIHRGVIKVIGHPSTYILCYHTHIQLPS